MGLDMGRSRQGASRQGAYRQGAYRQWLYGLAFGTIASALTALSWLAGAKWVR